MALARRAEEALLVAVDAQLEEDRARHDALGDEFPLATSEDTETFDGLTQGQVLNASVPSSMRIGGASSATGRGLGSRGRQRTLSRKNHR